MSAAITEIITAAGFELVRDALGAMLALEIANQQELQELTDPLNFYQERMIPFDAASEQLMFNLSMEGADNSNFTQLSREGKTNYYIEIFAAGKQTPASAGQAEIQGSFDAAKRLHKYLGLCCYILSSPKTKALGFAPGLIAGSYVESIKTAPAEHNKEDTNYTRMGQITFSVRIQETQQGFTPSSLLGIDSNVSLDLTDLGYKYVLNNT